ncbi:MAG TPA: GNAT family N-acetyltransferase [Chitinophagaceae bacterium]|nr:GNAT family N-acetyltransferase [Chitinophagaceae bacterium]
MNTSINIINYADEHAGAFRDLNLYWLEHYNLLESHDLEVVNDPRGTILDRGGAIYLAQSPEGIVGSAAIVNAGNGEYELHKMAVAKQWQGQGISKLLIEKCIDTARQSGAERVTLFSNHQLTTAISLYEKYGFRHVEVIGSPFVTADIKMELILK